MKCRLFNFRINNVRVLQALHPQDFPHPRPNGPGRAFGQQNIIEGSKASVTSTASEIKLTNVARASLEELLEDFRDFLRETRPTHLGQGFQGSAIRPLQTGAEPWRILRHLPPVREVTPAGDGRQYRHLPHPPSQLPPRPANSAHGEGLSPKRWRSRANDAGTLGFASKKLGSYRSDSERAPGSGSTDHLANLLA